MVVFLAKLVEIVQMWLYSGKRRCIREKVVVFGKMSLYSGKWLCSGKVVVFRQKWLYLGKSGYI